MNKFIHRQNLALFRRRLDDPGLSDAQREAILRLLSEEQVNGHQTTSSVEDHGASTLIRANDSSSFLTSSRRHCASEHEA
jgi:hypothetical protein